MSTASVYSHSNKAETRPATLSVIIPALNEEDGITEIVERVKATEGSLREVGVEELEIIVVDDGSGDATPRIVDAMSSAKLVKHDRNRGYGAAIKTGFRQASGDLLAFLDADSTYPPEHFSHLCRVAIEQNADVVVGSRRSGAHSSMPAVRRFGNFIWSSLLSLIGNYRVKDPASGMRVLRRSALLRLYPLPDGLNFTPVMSTRALHEGLIVKEVPIPYHERSGRSKLNVVRDGTRFLKTIIWTALEYNPARVLELVGLSATSLAAAIGLGLIFARVQGITELGYWGVFAVYNSLVLAVAGVSVFSLGIFFNYLVALFHHRPVHQRNLVTKIFGDTIDRQFGWIGLLVAATGFALGGCSMYLGVNGWPIERIWLWLLGSALFVLIGIQLFLSWILMRVLETLNGREERVEADMGEEGTENSGLDSRASVNPAVSGTTN